MNKLQTYKDSHLHTIKPIASQHSHCEYQEKSIAEIGQE
jgi:hypothetical protein